MSSNRRSRAFAATMAASLLYSGTAFAIPTEWAVHSPSLSRATTAVGATSANGKVKLLAEFPQVAAGGTWRDSNQVHIFPIKVDAGFNITPLTNIRQNCRRMDQLVGRINSTQDGVMDILAVGLNQARQVGQLIDSLDAFKTGNNSAFLVVSTTNAENGGINATIAIFNDIIAVLRLVLVTDEERVTTLTGQHAAADLEAREGIPPNNPQIADLMEEKEALEDDIAAANRRITRAQQQGRPTADLIAERDELVAELAIVDADIATAAGPYRAAKRQEAATLAAQLTTATATRDETAGQISGIQRKVQEERLKLVANLTKPEYIAAQGVLGQYSQMLRTYTQLNQEFRDYRKPIIEDAMLVVNIAKLNFNDLASFDAGYGSGTLPLWDDSALTLPSQITSATANQTRTDTYIDFLGRSRTVTTRLPAVNAVLGTLYDVKFNTQEGTILSTPPAKYSTYSIDEGRIRPLELPVGDVDDAQKFAGYTTVRVLHAADSTTTDVVTDVRVNDQVDVKETLRSTGTNPQAQVKLGLGSYCGALAGQTSTVSRVDDTGFGMSFERIRYVYPTRQPGLYPVSYSVDYKIPAQETPHVAQCEVHVSDYYAASRNWGSRTFSILGLFKRTTRWDDRHIEELNEQGFTCTFVTPTPSMTPDQKREVDALNELALSEAYARFLKVTAKEWHTQEADPETMRKWLADHEGLRHTWSPSYQLLCGGNPICDVVVDLFKNTGDIAASGATSIEATGRLDMTVKTQRTWATMLPGQVTGQVSFNIPN